MATGLRDGFEHLARLVQMLLNHGQGLIRKSSHILIVAKVGFTLEIAQVFLMIFDHMLSIGAIKGAGAQMGQMIVGLLFLKRVWRAA